jgi:hypothetical protein
LRHMRSSKSKNPMIHNFKLQFLPNTRIRRSAQWALAARRQI